MKTLTTSTARKVFRSCFKEIYGGADLQDLLFVNATDRVRAYGKRNMRTITYGVSSSLVSWQFGGLTIQQHFKKKNELFELVNAVLLDLGYSDQFRMTRNGYLKIDAEIA